MYAWQRRNSQVALQVCFSGSTLVWLSQQITVIKSVSHYLVLCKATKITFYWSWGDTIICANSTDSKMLTLKASIWIIGKGEPRWTLWLCFQRPTSRGNNRFFLGDSLISKVIWCWYLYSLLKFFEGFWKKSLHSFPSSSTPFLKVSYLLEAIFTLKFLVHCVFFLGMV